MFFRGTDERVYNYWWNPSTNKWQRDALDYNAPANIAGDLVLNSLGDHLFFRGTDERVYNYWWNPSKPGGNKWRLDALDYNAPANAAGDLVLNSSGDHLFFSRYRQACVQLLVESS